MTELFLPDVSPVSELEAAVLTAHYLKLAQAYWEIAREETLRELLLLRTGNFPTAPNLLWLTSMEAAYNNLGEDDGQTG